MGHIPADGMTAIGGNVFDLNPYQQRAYDAKPGPVDINPYRATTYGDFSVKLGRVQLSQ
jgi:hypothetical protein